MNRAKRLQPVADLEAREADRQAQTLSGLNEHVARERRRLEELVQYREEYEARCADRNTIMRAGRLVELQAFMAQLSDAIERQRSAVAQAEERAGDQEQAWREQRAKAKALALIVERHRRDEVRKLERQAQRNADEMSLRKLGGES